MLTNFRNRASMLATSSQTICGEDNPDNVECNCQVGNVQSNKGSKLIII